MLYFRVEMQAGWLAGWRAQQPFQHNVNIHVSICIYSVRKRNKNGNTENERVSIYRMIFWVCLMRGIEIKLCLYHFRFVFIYTELFFIHIPFFSGQRKKRREIEMREGGWSILIHLMRHRCHCCHRRYHQPINQLYRTNDNHFSFHFIPSFFFFIYYYYSLVFFSQIVALLFFI